MKRLWLNIWPILRNKYVIAMLVFTVWIIFFSQYNLLDRGKLARNLRELKSERSYYHEKISVDSTRLHELSTNKDNLEKFAREHYYMKKDNEDIFVIVP